MHALLYVDSPHWKSIIFRRHYTDLAQPGALMERAREWLATTDAKWNQPEHRWYFPSGASMTFGHMSKQGDRYKYQGAEYTGVHFDELTQFPEQDYRYLFSRIRRVRTSKVPLRMRSSTNPGGLGHEWVKQRFLEEQFLGRVFLQARLEDNPSLDPEEYAEMLAELDPITRQQLRHGDWNSRPTGGMFNRLWFLDPSRGRHLLDEWPTHVTKAVRFWDLAATEVKAGADPDYTAGALVGLRSDGKWVIGDIQRFRESPAEVERRIKAQAEMDGRAVAIRIEQEPGASGVTVIDHYARKVLLGYDFKGYRATGKKSVRARPFSAAAELGNVLLVRGRWISAFFDEVEAFPLAGTHDDQVDAVSGGIADIMGGTSVTRRQELVL